MPTKQTDIRILDARMDVEHLTFRSPLKFGGRVVSHYQIVNVELDVRTRGGQEATGFGSMPIGHIWAWPTQLDANITEGAMRKLSERMMGAAESLTDFADPFQHGWSLAEGLARECRSLTNESDLGEPIPRLAALVAASPIDAALHDAFGKANGLNSYAMLGSTYLNRDLSAYLNDEFRGEYPDRYTQAAPKPSIPLYHLVGALDPLSTADVVTPLRDGLPETLAEWIPFNGLTHLKIKLAGDDLTWDVDRVTAIEQIAQEVQSKIGRTDWHYSLDFNEKCHDVSYVLEFLQKVRERSPLALDRVQYIEQPTHRDLQGRGKIDMHAASAIKPVVIDEALVDFESLLLARELGYTGIALKACKGQTESLLAAAAAAKYGMFLCVQDLTCPGASFLQSAELAAHIPGVAAIEGNGRQYCPGGNVKWAKQYPGMFEITDGRVHTGSLSGPGLGH